MLRVEQDPGSSPGAHIHQSSRRPLVLGVLFDDSAYYSDNRSNLAFAFLTEAAAGAAAAAALCMVVEYLALGCYCCLVHGRVE